VLKTPFVNTDVITSLYKIDKILELLFSFAAFLSSKRFLILVEKSLVFVSKSAAASSKDLIQS
jgi:hypothetical protein